MSFFKKRFGMLRNTLVYLMAEEGFPYRVGGGLVGRLVVVVVTTAGLLVVVVVVVTGVTGEK